MIVCLCQGVTHEDLKEALLDADESVELSDIIWHTDATTGCGACKEYIQQMIEGWLDAEFRKKNKKRKKGRVR